jgi:hypothetical protein
MDRITSKAVRKVLRRDLGVSANLAPVEGSAETENPPLGDQGSEDVQDLARTSAALSKLPHRAGG